MSLERTMKKVGKSRRRVRGKVIIVFVKKLTRTEMKLEWSGVRAEMCQGVCPLRVPVKMQTFVCL